MTTRFRTRSGRCSVCGSSNTVLQKRKPICADARVCYRNWQKRLQKVIPDDLRRLLS